MPLVVEDGSGLSNAESYISVENADAYHAAKGNVVWAGVASVKEQALRRATAYIDGRYAGRWPGYRTRGRLQALAWPRSLVVDGDGEDVPDDEVPAEVAQATCEAAVRALSGPLITDRTAEDQRVKRRKIDVIETEFDTSAAGSSARPVYPVIDQLLTGLLLPIKSSSSVAVQRA